MEKKTKQSEIEYVLDCLHLGIHSGDGTGINRLHWIGFVDFIIKNPEVPKKELVHKLISVLCVKERTVMEYINCSVAWGILKFEDGLLLYNCTYPSNNQMKLTDLKNLKQKQKLADTQAKADLKKYGSHDLKGKGKGKGIKS